MSVFLFVPKTTMSFSSLRPFRSRRLPALRLLQHSQAVYTRDSTRTSPTCSSLQLSAAGYGFLPAKNLSSSSTLPNSHIRQAAISNREALRIRCSGQCASFIRSRAKNRSAERYISFIKTSAQRNFPASARAASAHLLISQQIK